MYVLFVAVEGSHGGNVDQPWWLEPMGAEVCQPWWLEPMGAGVRQPWWLEPMGAEVCQPLWLEPLGLMFVCLPLWLDPMGAIMSQPWWLEPDILYQPWWLGPMEANIASALVAGAQGANIMSAIEGYIILCWPCRVLYTADMAAED